MTVKATTTGAGLVCPPQPKTVDRHNPASTRIRVLRPLFRGASNKIKQEMGSATKAAERPSWAYLDNPPGVTPAPDTGAPLHVPDSDAAFTLTQIRNLFFSPDWHPADHSPMPPIVSQGSKPNVRACGSCHRSDGAGGPENAKVAGLPVDYIVQQMRQADLMVFDRPTHSRGIMVGDPVIRANLIEKVFRRGSGG